MNGEWEWTFDRRKVIRRLAFVLSVFPDMTLYTLNDVRRLCDAIRVHLSVKERNARWGPKPISVKRVLERQLLKIESNRKRRARAKYEAFLLAAREKEIDNLPSAYARGDLEIAETLCERSPVPLYVDGGRWVRRHLLLDEIERTDNWREYDPDA